MLAELRSPATMADFRSAAKRVSNWGRWGENDQLGTLNFITQDTVAAASRLARVGKVFPLGVEFGSSGPQGDFLYRQNPVHLMTVDGGDADTFIKHSVAWSDNPVAKQIGDTFAASPLRFNDDMIIMPLQAATQWDALSHVYYEQQLYNGFASSAVSSQGAARCSIAAAIPKGIVARGVLLDVVRHRGQAVCIDAENRVTPQELDAIAAAQGVRIESGDVVLVHTGWWTEFRRTGSRSPAVAGLHWRCAEWLHEREAAAIACDNVAVEHLLTMDVDGMFLPFHALCLRDMGLMLGEFWDVSKLAADCAADGVFDCQIVAPPLNITGAVGSPVNPIAIK
jgi:kynurenine formamidase